MSPQMLKMKAYKEYFVYWRLGGNWVAFFLSWFIVSAIISALEHTQENIYLSEEEESLIAVKGINEFLKGKKDHFESNANLTKQLEKVVKTLEASPTMAKLWTEIDLETALVQHHMIKSLVGVFKDEFKRVKTSFTSDSEVAGLADKVVRLLSENRTVELFQKSGDHHMRKMKELDEERKRKCKERKEAGKSCGEDWSFGQALHFTSTVFTTLGYGAHTPITAGGKIITIILICFQIPFFLHCLATTASNINRVLNIILGMAPLHEDLESLTEESANQKQRTLVTLQGLVILAGVLVVHLFVAAIYHYVTTGFSFIDVLYFEFVRVSSVGFGDIVPEDEYTLAGAIFKNILVNIPSQVLTFAMLIRVLPIIS